MNRFNYIGMLAYVALSMSSCDDSFDVSSKADGVLAVSQEGFNTLQSYNVGEKYTADLWIQQGGLKSTAKFFCGQSFARFNEYCRWNLI